MPRSDRRIQPITSTPTNLTPDVFERILNDKIEEMNSSLSSLDLLESEVRGEDSYTPTYANHVNMQGNRITNAAQSQSDTDYVTRGELRRNGLYADHTGRLVTQRVIETSAGVMSAPALALNEAVTLGPVYELFKQAVPPGVILLGSGAAADIPSGWALCDGSGGTPDLRDRFVVGATSTYAVGATGGQNTINIQHAHTADGTLATDSQGAHTHSADGTLATDSQGAHSHSADGTLATATPSATTTVDTVGAGATVAVASSTHTHDVSGDSSSNGAHVHDVTGNTSSNGAHVHDVTGSTSTSLSAAQD